MCARDSNCLLVVVDRAQKDTFSTVEWAKKIKPRAYGRRLVALNDLVFEWDPKRLKSDSNPGYGVAVGRVVDPHGATLTVEWRDGETTTIKRCNVRPAPKVDSKHGQKCVMNYTPTGVVLRKPKKTKRKAQNNATSGAKKSPAPNTPKKKKQKTSRSKSPAPSTPKKTAAARKAPSPRWKQRVVKQKKLRCTWTFSEDGENPTKTKALLPGPLFDCVFKRIVLVRGEDKKDKTKFVMEADGKSRSKCHFRAPTNAEFEREHHLLEAEKEKAQKEKAEKEEAQKEKAEKEEAEKEQRDAKKVAQKWGRFKNMPSLPAGVLRRLKPALVEADVDMNKHPALYYKFIERVAQKYVHDRGDREQDMHEDRDAKCREAIEVILCTHPHGLS